MSAKNLHTCFFRSLFFCVALAFIDGFETNAQQITGAESSIRLNQMGFYPNGPKTAIILNAKGDNFYIVKPDNTNVFKGTLTRSFKPNLAGNYTSIADFTTFNKTGKYLVYIPGLGTSYPFEIKKAVNQKAANAGLKAFYYMRASIPLKEKYAGKWSRAEGHPDTNILIHGSAVSDKRPEGTIISAPRGWYDAGDYNKYIVNSGISTGTLLSLYEDFPEYMKTVKLNIPESGNKVPDVLNEILWNLRWMLAMQDPDDGGVYNKLTNAAFDKFEMPDQGTEPRYVVQKGTAATLDFAAVTAQASRIFAKFPKALPGLADSCLNQSKKAWEWAVKNPKVAYNQNVINQKFTPKIVTGGYGDNNFTDEFIWAASELYVSTGDDAYLANINLMPDDKMPLPAWAQVRLLGYYSLIKSAGLPGYKEPKELPELKKRLLAFADTLISGALETAYQTVMSKSRRYGWGSNSDAANQGIVLIQAYKLSGDNKYLNYALDNLDYILGRNGTGYSYVTGCGSKTPMHPHHRPSGADGIADPIPGLLVGGPNPGMQDGVKVPSRVPDEAYIDDEQAFAANEIAINWNAPFAYLANAIEALQDRIRVIIKHETVN